jgi:hypothetical protein
VAMQDEEFKDLFQSAFTPQQRRALAEVLERATETDKVLANEITKGLRQQRDYAEGLAMTMLTGVLTLSAQVTVLQHALLKARVVSGEDLDKAQAEIRAYTAIEEALNPEWIAQREEMERLRDQIKRQREEESREGP